MPSGSSHFSRPAEFPPGEDGESENYSDFESEDDQLPKVRPMVEVERLEGRDTAGSFCSQAKPNRVLLIDCLNPS